MGRRRFALVLGGAALLLVLVVWSAAVPLELWSAAGREGNAPQLDPPPIDLQPIEPPEEFEFDAPDDSSAGLSNVLATVIVGAAVCIAALVALAIWRRLRRLLSRRRAAQPPPGGEFPDVVDVVEAVAEATDPDDPQLHRGSPRNAIVACWMRLCAAVEASGLRPDPAETSTELTQRVLASYALDRQPVAGLAALYREARFSDHELAEAARQRAIALLADVHSQFRLAVEVQRQLEETTTETTAEAPEQTAR